MQEKMKIKATGRRKEAAARVEIVAGDGKIIVNKRAFEVYFPRETDRILVNQPFVATDTSGKYDVRASVMGGGLTGQAGALRHGISRVLATIENEYKLILRKGDYLTRDPRTKERKKYGQKGARKKFQWTKR